jgi:hypothetical protein
MDINHEPLPALIPPHEAQKDWQPETVFWQILTGQKVFDKEDINTFFRNNMLSLPPSELRFFDWEKDDKGKQVYRELQNPILVQPGKEGFSPQEVLHQSWLGVQDNSLRMYVFDEKGLEALQQKLKSLGIPFESLKTGLGIMVKTKIPAIVKDEKNGEIKKGEVEGVVFFLKEDALQTPADALALVAEIAKLHPETAKDLMSSLLIKARVVSHNIQVWRDVLKAYETGQLLSELDLPSLSQLHKAFQDIFSQIKSYLEKIPDDLVEFEKGLTEKFKEFKATPLEKIDDLPLPLIDENEVIKHLRRILKIALNEPEFFQILPKPVKKLARKFTKKILEQKNPKRLKRLLRRLENNIIKTPDVVNEAYDPKKLLLTEVAERGQQLMLDRMEPSDGMISEMIRILDEELFNNKTIKSWNNLIVEKSKKIFSQILFYGDILDPEAIDEIQQQIEKLKPHVIELWNQKHPDKPLPKNVREWIKAMGINEEMSKLIADISDAEAKPLNEKQQKQYQAAYQSVEQEIQKILETTTADEQQENIELDQFPPHPILARWGEIWEEIEKKIIDKFEEPVKDKIRAVFEAKRKLAEKQEYYTNLFLETTIKYMPGGYDGWNEELKGVLRPLLEASPYFAPLFKEPNCVGRMILLSGMLMKAQVFKEEDLVTMASYWHVLLGGFDALGVGRVIEGSGYPINSYFGIPEGKIFQGKVFDDPEIILQLPLQVGLITEAGVNYSSHLEKQKARKLKLYLLQQSGYIKDSLWYNLSINLDNLDSFFSRSRAASINNFLPQPFYYLLYDNEIFNKTFKALEQEKFSLLLPYIKLNLLVMEKALNDEKNANELRIRINGRKKFTKDDVETMKKNLQTLLSNLADIEIPSYWQKKYGPNLENATIEQMREDLWNPNLFPKPVAIDDEGNATWKMPSP